MTWMDVAKFLVLFGGTMFITLLFLSTLYNLEKGGEK